MTDELIQDLFDARQWRPVKKVLRSEVVRFGTKVVGKFKAPDLMDQSMDMAKQL